MQPSFDYSAVDDILALYGKKESNIIAILQDVQEHYHYLPREVFPYLSRALGVSEARLYSVATFYENFSLEKKGRFVIRVCDGTACHVRKSIPILERFRKELSLTAEKKQHRMADLQSRPSPASAPAGWRPSSRSTSRFILP